MRKTLHNSKRTQKIGFFTKTERDSILQGKLNYKIKSNLIGTKNGRCSEDLHAIVTDLHLIAENPMFYNWKQDSKIVQDLVELDGIVQEMLRFKPFSRKKIAATEINGQRMFHMKKIKMEVIAESGTQTSMIHKILRKGLKPNEWKIIEEYIKKIGYVFPLDENKEYTWKEVKKQLLGQLNNKQNTVDEKVRGVMEERMNSAWSMIRSKINKEFQNEIISKTGFGIQLLQYKQSL